MKENKPEVSRIRVNTVIVVPVFNDWKALDLLLQGIDKSIEPRNEKICVIVVNDGSNLKQADNESYANYQSIPNLFLLHLKRNVGHQRAIAIGLCYVEENVPCKRVIVMDSDGEDKPDDILKLLDLNEKKPDRVLFASRVSRSEGGIFSLFYILYKILFRMLTGTYISFGNFCLIPYHSLYRIVFLSEIWNNFPAGVIRSKIPIVTVPTDRGKRLVGESTMNITSLVAHGLSAISVFVDILTIRVIFISIVLVILTFIGFATVIAIKFLTDLAIPGWATNVVLSLTILLIQGLSVSMLFIFMVLSYRTQKTLIPICEYKAYIQTIDKIKRNCSAL